MICQRSCWFKCPLVLYKEKIKGDWRQLIIYYSGVWDGPSTYPSHNILKFLALNIGFINQVFLHMLFWSVVPFLTSLAAMMSEWWSWDTFERSVGSKAGASFTITVLKIKHTAFFWTCCPPTSCSAPLSNHEAHLLPHLSLQNRKGNCSRISVSPGSCPAAVPTLLLQGIPPCWAEPAHGNLQLCIQITRDRKWRDNSYFFPF